MRFLCIIRLVLISLYQLVTVVQFYYNLVAPLFPATLFFFPLSFDLFDFVYTVKLLVARRVCMIFV